MQVYVPLFEEGEAILRVSMCYTLFVYEILRCLGLKFSQRSVYANYG